MANEINYFNPDSVRPKYDAPVDPWTAGVMRSQDRSRYQDMASLQDLMVSTDAKRQLEDYTQGVPVRAAERQAQIAQAPLKTAQLQNQVTEGGLKNIITQGTSQSTIDATNAGNEAKTNDAHLMKLEQGISTAQAIANMGGTPGPLLIQKLQSMKLDPSDPVVQSILHAQTPDEMVKRATYALQALSNARASYRTEMDKTRLHEGNANYRTELTAQATVDAANARAKAAHKSLVETFMKGNSDTRLEIGAAIMANPNIDDNVKTMVSAMMEQARVNKANASADKQGIDLSGYGIPKAPIDPNKYKPGANSPIVNPAANGWKIEKVD